MQFLLSAWAFAQTVFDFTLISNYDSSMSLTSTRHAHGLRQSRARAAASDVAMRAFKAEALASNASFLQRLDPDGCRHVSHNFLNFQTYPGYDNSIGVSGAGPNGYRMFSSTSDINDPNTESRLRYDFVFNDGSAPYTSIWITMRGAPDSGKNSNVVLREGLCVVGPLDPNGSHYHDCDEIDIAEIYGGGNNQAEFTFYTGSGSYIPGKPPQRQGGGVYTDTTNGAAGQQFYEYQLYLEQGKYLTFTIADVKTGQTIGKRDYGPPGIPSKPLNFFMGEYNFRGFETYMSRTLQTTVSKLHPVVYEFLLHACICCREAVAISTDQNSCGVCPPQTTTYPALVLNEEWSYATCTPSPLEPWQVGGSFDVQVAALAPHYTNLYEPPHTFPPRSLA
ncbi:uncharacterized protein LACBIDRAFT_328291 [Laccaria bicolor S238N-H82]|uniref:Predicted protein n=1 Tax=Laccaria bicolor (strain S238N-H82 / ATCC MYA-4686) TaxID=486041 RepID=B0DEF7_LACBS|nr:uncharacterized protein LACBIDRAFT_328291 [Laccaria bicolor S238N-H82]EDR06927.1 predicted protein [Laccaria bicolor S238N-H82]|eukprot:XP_001882300.1 predicted protein [Laccaria bicolor S238N-H82]